MWLELLSGVLYIDSSDDGHVGIKPVAPEYIEISSFTEVSQLTL
jgi:hypothetical protein